MNNSFENNKNKIFTYEPSIHVTVLDNKERVFCRMANAILKFEPDRCFNCPLWNGEARVVCCTYYDFGLPPEAAPSEAKKHTEGMIKLGISKEFPDFVEERSVNGFERNDNALVYEKALQFAAEAHKGSYRNCNGELCFENTFVIYFCRSYIAYGHSVFLSYIYIV